jgi:hypothetical protein
MHIPVVSTVFIASEKPQFTGKPAIRVGPMFADFDAAAAWKARAIAQAESAPGESGTILSSSYIETITMDEDSLDYLEYQPDFKVTLDVDIRKSITIIVSGDDAEDENDAVDLAKSQLCQGDYDDRLDSAVAEDIAIVDYEVEEAE